MGDQASEPKFNHVTHVLFDMDGLLLGASMSSKGKIDPTWDYCTETSVPGTNICNFCKEPITGGVYRMKFHLARLRGNVCKICTKVDQDVQRQFVVIVEANVERRETKKRTQAEQGIGIPPIPPPPPPQPSFEEGAANVEPTPASRMMHPEGSSSAQRCDFFAPRGGGQTTLDSAWNKRKWREARKTIANFWYYSNLPFNVANSPFWEYMVTAIASCGIGFKAPTYSDLQGPLLEEVVIDCRRVIDEQKKIWKKKGCSILSDGWTDAQGRTLLNFLAYSAGHLVFLKSVDASGHVKNHDFLFEELKLVIDEVGPEHVVQVITDNASAYVKAGERIEERYSTICWTPCAAHVLDLLLEDIGKIPWIKEIIDKAKNITKFIYNHSWVLHLMKTEFTNGKGLVRSATRFSTSFLTLQSVYEVQFALKQMVVGNKWMESRYAKEPEGKNVVNCLFDDDFWTSIIQILRITEPLVRVLRLVDTDKPSMGYVYEAMDKAKEAISTFFANDAIGFQYILDMVDRRWNLHLNKPLHGAALYLNPKYFYADNFDFDDGEINAALHKTINRMVPDREIRHKIFTQELQHYKKAEGYLFSSPECVEARSTLAPDLWWEDYGGKTPNLQKVAIKILCQPASASGCERNWSIFEHIHSKKRNRLTQECLNDLVFVHYNLRLRHKTIEGTSNEALDLEDIEANDVWASWLKEVSEEVQDFDFNFDDYQRMEEEAIALAEEEARVAMDEGGSSTEAPPVQQMADDPEDEIDDDTPLVASRNITRATATKERERRGKQSMFRI